VLRVHSSQISASHWLQTAATGTVPQSEHGVLAQRAHLGQAESNG
jgi:hypothetical protein